MLPWTVASSLTSIDSRVDKCAAEFLASAIAIENNKAFTVESNSTFVRADSMLSQLISSKEQSRNVRVVYNAYAHLHIKMIGPLTECYNRTGLSEMLRAKLSQFATRSPFGVGRWWLLPACSRMSATERN